jgi:cytochrome c oxidase subunit 2
MNILLILAVVFGTLVLVRLANVAAIASKLSQENEEAEQESANRWNSIGMLAFLIAGIITMFYLIDAYSPLMLPVSASEHGVTIDNLMSVNWIVLFITFLITQILLFFFAFKYRFNKNRNLSKTRNHAHKTISIPLFWRNFSSSNRSAYISEE